MNLHKNSAVPVAPETTPLKLDSIHIVSAPAGAVKNLAWLKAQPHFLCWSLIPQEDGTVEKIPYNPNTGYKAKANVPTTWVDFETAKAAVLAGQYDSIGIALSKDLGLTIVDFDKVIAKPGDPWPQWVLNIVEDLDSYTEVSASGRGMHALAWGSIPSNINRQKQKIEIHDNVKMFAISTNVFEGRDEIFARPEKLQALYQRILDGKVGPGMVVQNTVSEKLAWLAAGNDNGDKSEGDFEYIRLLLEQNPAISDEQLEETFSASGRYREKWDREDYRVRTIANARQKQSHIVTPSKPVVDPNEWPTLFHTYDEAINAPPLTFAIEGFLQEGGITFMGGLAGHGKTLIMLNIAKALLEGDPLFGHKDFRVTKPAKRVLYLIPESGLGPFVHRLKVFRLLDHVKAGRLFFRTLTSREPLELDDPRLLKAAEGADVFLDTAVRFMSGEENSASDHRKFADLLFNLQRVGARTVTGAHHSPKAFENKDQLSLENAFRGSGDVGAMLATAWAVKQVDSATNRLYIKNVKPRDFEPCAPFEIEGRPHIDLTGAFKMASLPGMAKSPVKQEVKPEIIQAKLLRQAGKTLAEIADHMGVAPRTVERWSAKGLLA